jgi:hypothetical protein
MRRSFQQFSSKKVFAHATEPELVQTHVGGVHANIPFREVDRLVEKLDIPRIRIETRLQVPAGEGDFTPEQLNTIYDALKTKGMIILNLQPPAGTPLDIAVGHEVALINRGNHIDYFDSNGILSDNFVDFYAILDPNDPIVKLELLPDINEALIFLRDRGEVIEQNRIQLQSINLPNLSPEQGTCYLQCIMRCLFADYDNAYYCMYLKERASEYTGELGVQYDAYILETLRKLTTDSYLVEQGNSLLVPELGGDVIPYAELVEAKYKTDEIDIIRHREALQRAHEYGAEDWLLQQRKKDIVSLIDYQIELVEKAKEIEGNEYITDDTYDSFMDRLADMGVYVINAEDKLDDRLYGELLKPPPNITATEMGAEQILAPRAHHVDHEVRDEQAREREQVRQAIQAGIIPGGGAGPAEGAEEFERDLLKEQITLLRNLRL